MAKPIYNLGFRSLSALAGGQRLISVANWNLYGDRRQEVATEGGKAIWSLYVGYMANPGRIYRSGVFLHLQHHPQLYIPSSIDILHRTCIYSPCYPPDPFLFPVAGSSLISFTATQSHHATLPPPHHPSHHPSSRNANPSALNPALKHSTPTNSISFP